VSNLVAAGPFHSSGFSSALGVGLLLIAEMCASVNSVEKGEARVTIVEVELRAAAKEVRE
jgi:hypothetical protein